MAQREFTDSHGTHWLIWNTTPTPGAVLAGEMQQGWLTFESDGERRRLVPIPRDWEKAATDRLELYCRAAQAVSRTTPIHGIPPVPETETDA
ncbi:MAG TPA: hypothetical protein VGH98_20815 [Gemmatimonadaceae bacterium]|jgi:hypothetical protein